MSETKEAMKGSDIAAIKKAKENLTAASHKLAEAIYKEAQNKQAPPPPGGVETEQAQGQPSQGDNVVDAEVVGEEKK
jgi:molecular chaperone DnaK